MASCHDFVNDSLMGNPAVCRVETNMVMGSEKRSVYVPVDEESMR